MSTTMTMTMTMTTKTTEVTVSYFVNHPHMVLKYLQDGGIGNPPMSMQQFSWMTGIGGCILVGLPIFLMWHRRRGYLKEKVGLMKL